MLIHLYDGTDQLLRIIVLSAEIVALALLTDLCVYARMHCDMTCCSELRCLV